MATVTIEVIAIPRLDDDIATTGESTPVVVGILGNDSNVPTEGTLTVAAPSNGTVSVDDGGTPNNPSDDVVTYTPDGGFSGADIFTYIVCNQLGDCDMAIIAIEVIATPRLNDDLATIGESTPVVVGILDNDSNIKLSSGGIRDIEFLTQALILLNKNLFGNV